MEYIEGVDKSEGCFLCDACTGEEERERLVLWRTEVCVTVMNRFPYNNGHLLVAPVQHVGDLDELSGEQLQCQMLMLQRCERNLRRVMEPDGFNIGLNIGRPAGAGVEDHLHWHIVPRWNGDTNFMAVTGATKVIPQALEDLWGLLKEADEEG
jgi:ATP adenylyltransferase